MGQFAACCFLLNLTLGPALVHLPPMFQRAGWVFSSLVLLAMAYGAYAVALLSARISRRLLAVGVSSDYTNLVRASLPPHYSMLALCALTAAFAAQALASITVSSQVADNLLLSAVRKTCALVLYPQTAGQSAFRCVEAVGEDSVFQIDETPFGAGTYTVSIGWLVVLAVCAPLACLTLSRLGGLQVIGSALGTGCVLVWLAQFFAAGLDGSLLSPFGTQQSVTATGSAPASASLWCVQAYAPLLPVAISCFAFVAAVPSWVAQQDPQARIGRSIGVVTAVGLVFSLATGVLGAMAFPYPGNVGLLAVLSEGADARVWMLSQVAAFVLPLASMVTATPLLCALIRSNLTATGMLPGWSATLLGLALPWLASVLAYGDNGVWRVLCWGGAILLLPVHLLLPAVFALRRGKLQRLAAALAAASQLQGAAHGAPPASHDTSLMGGDGGEGGGERHSLGGYTGGGGGLQHGLGGRGGGGDDGASDAGNSTRSSVHAMMAHAAGLLLKSGQRRGGAAAREAAEEVLDFNHHTSSTSSALGSLARGSWRARGAVPLRMEPLPPLSSRPSPTAFVPLSAPALPLRRSRHQHLSQCDP